MLACVPFSAQNFHMIWQSSEPLPQTFVDSNLDATPTLTGQQTVCTGVPTTVSLSATSVWDPTSFDSGTANGATDVSQLLTPPSPSSNFTPRWITQTQSNQLFNYVNPLYVTPRYFVWYPSSSNQWDPFLTSIGITNYASYEYATRTKYKDFATSSWYSSGQPYKAYTGLMCNAKANIVWAAGQSSVDYLGVPVIQSISFPSAGTYAVSGNLTVQRCMAPIRNDGTYPTRDVYVVANTAFQPTFLAPQKTIIVKNPFSCNLAALSFSQMSMNNSTTYNFNLVVKNNGDSVNVTSITLVQPSSFTAFAVTSPPMPYTLGAGAQNAFTGSVKAPAVPGIYTLTVLISSISTVPSCTGTTANCNLQASFTINVTAQNGTPPANNSTNIPISCTLAFQGHTANFTAPDSAVVAATCRNITNGVVPCGFLAWSTNATGGSVAPASTTTPPNPSQTTFTASYTNAPQSAYVKAQQGSNFSCSISASILPPDYVSTITAPASAQAGTAFSATVETKNIGSAASATTTTRLQFNGGAPQAFLVPGLSYLDTQQDTGSFTCPITPGTYWLNSTADATGLLAEASESNNNDSQMINCTAAAPTPKPNYVPNITAPSVALVGVYFTADFGTRNIGTAGAASASTTRVTFQSTVANFTVAPLAVNAQQVDSREFACDSPGTKSLIERVDFYNNISESIESDNQQLWPVACYTAPTSCNLSFDGPGSTLYQYTSAPVHATCFAGGAQTACPPFLWQQNAAMGSMSPANTIADWTPNSTLSISGPVATQLGRKVNATSTLAGVPLYCELPFTVSDGSPIGPDYIVPSIVPDHPSTALGQVVHFTVTVTNQGNVNATNDSISAAAFSSGCEMVRDSYSLPPINALASHVSTNVIACICRIAGTQNITVSANPTHAQWETDFGNNDGARTFICQAPFPTITCSYFV